MAASTVTPAVPTAPTDAATTATATTKQLSVKESARFIAETAEHVSIPPEGVRRTAATLIRAMAAGEFGLENWRKHPLNPQVADAAAAAWIFAVDTLNFSFWHDDDAAPYAVRLADGSRHIGYWSLCAAVNRGIAEGIAVTSPQWMAAADADAVAAVFRSDTATPIPLLPQRVAALNEAGRVLVERFEGSVERLIAAADHSAARLVQIVVDNFSSYADRCEYRGQTVAFYKRAQILVADLWACFEGRGMGRFDDIDDAITMFADYRVPQALAYLGALRYDEALRQRLAGDGRLAAGDALEAEIRGCSIHSVECVRAEMQRLFAVVVVDGGGGGGDDDVAAADAALAGLTAAEVRAAATKRLNAVVIDFYLWDYAKAHRDELQHVPIHKTRGIFY